MERLSSLTTLSRCRPMLVAHRGSSGDAPENTFVAFDLAVTQEADAIELDLRLTRDGVPVAIHDSTLERTTNGSGPVAGATLAEIRGLDAGSWFGVRFAGQCVPTLEEVLRRYHGRIFLKLELKASPQGDEGLAERVADLLRRYLALNEVEVFSFDQALAKRVKAMRPELVVGICYQEHVPFRLAPAHETEALVLHIPWATIRPETVVKVHQAGVLVDAWTVNDLATAQRLAEWGVDCITTDYPARMAPIRKIGH